MVRLVLRQEIVPSSCAFTRHWAAWLPLLLGMRHCSPRASDMTGDIWVCRPVHEGGSGTGKSTTLRLMAGLLAPDRGEVVVQGIPRRGLASDDAGIGKCANLICTHSLHLGTVGTLQVCQGAAGVRICLAQQLRTPAVRAVTPPVPALRRDRRQETSGTDATCTLCRCAGACRSAWCFRAERCSTA